MLHLLPGGGERFKAGAIYWKRPAIYLVNGNVMRPCNGPIPLPGEASLASAPVADGANGPIFPQQAGSIARRERI